MKSLVSLLMVGLLLPLSSIAANAPSQQKVIREVVIKSEPAKVWALLKDFGSIQKWHPDVESVKLESKKDEAGADVPHRLLKLKGGNTILEKLVSATDEDMKLEYRIVEGALPVSGYRAIMQIKAGPGAGETTLSWTGRFYNKANDVHAKPGEDNEAAVKAVEAFYDPALPALKKLLEQ